MAEWDAEGNEEHVSEVQALRLALSEVQTLLAEQNALAHETNTALEDVEERLESFVPRSKFWWVIAGMVVVILLVAAAGWVVRDRDATLQRERAAAIQREAEFNRQNAIAGCERGNDGRASLRRVIERAYAPTQYPPEVLAGLPQSLRDLIAEGQERQAALREEQLADPGIQHVDCQAQYPARPGLDRDR